MSDPTPLDRTLDAFRLLVRNEDPLRAYSRIHEYTVESFDGSTLSASPLDPTVTPQLPTGVPYTPSLPGATVFPQAGTLVYVFFANGDPTKPRVFSFGAPSTLWEKLGVNEEFGRVVCYGDQVSIAVIGAVAKGPIIQDPASAANKISLVQGRKPG